MGWFPRCSTYELNQLDPNEGAMATGTVVFYHDEDGYGFLETDEVEDDVFFHISDVTGLSGREPEEEDEFEFDVEEVDRGLQAFNITPLES